MAQKRMLSRRLAVSKSIHALKGNDRARFLYTLLLPYTDREGRINANPHGLKGTILEPFEYTADEIEQALYDLQEAGLLILYSTSEYKLIAEYAKFSDFNTPHPKEPESDFPSPDSDEAEIVDADGLERVPASSPGSDDGGLPSTTPTNTQPPTPEKGMRARESSEDRFERRMRTGGKANEVHRVRATCRHLAGEKFTRDFEGELDSWARWSDADIERLWHASSLDKWPKDRKRGVWRWWIFADLLREKRTPPAEPKAQPTEPLSGGDLLDYATTLNGSWSN